MSSLKKIRVLPAVCLSCLVVLPSTHAQRATSPKGQFAFVHSMAPTAGGFTLTVDYAELLSGDAAENAAREDGKHSPKELTDPYIENRTQRLRTLNVPAWAQVYLLQGKQPTLVKPAVLYSLLQGEKSPFGTFYGFPYRCEGASSDCLPVRIIQRGGRVLRIEQETVR
jgi:hypothetical protein